MHQMKKGQQAQILTEISDILAKMQLEEDTQFGVEILTPSLTANWMRMEVIQN